MSQSPEASEPPRRWTGWQPLVQLGLTLLALAVLAACVDLDLLVGILAGLSPGWTALALAAALADRGLMIAKWLPLLRLHLPEVTLVRATRAYLAAGFTNYFLPSAVGSDVLRAAALGRPHGRAMEVGASIAAERMLGIVGNACVAALALVLGARLAVPVGLAAPVALLGLLALIALGVAPLLAPVQRLADRLWREHWLDGLRTRVRRLVRAYAEHARFPRLLAGVMLLTLVEVFCPLLVHSLIARALGMTIGLDVLLIAVTLSGLISKVPLPLAIAGVGIQELTLATALAGLGIPLEQGAALAVATRLVDVAIAVPGALFLSDFGPALRRGPEPAQPRPAPD